MKETDRQTDRRKEINLFEILVAWTFSVRCLNATVAINRQNCVHLPKPAEINMPARLRMVFDFTVSL